ncbi:hypothetical protein J7K41_01925 [Candidatus Micrarchaeota archaeon]|nr:hypothetical protein [Candidatus Micrarchaeota archaeon]
MGKKGRGRETLVTCVACGRKVPRSKAVLLERPIVYSTDLKTGEDVKSVVRSKEYYCPSCAKHRHIYERKKRQLMRKRKE